jgi:hypothetical protein
LEPGGGGLSELGGGLHRTTSLQAGHQAQQGLQLFPMGGVVPEALLYGLALLLNGDDAIV